MARVSIMGALLLALLFASFETRDVRAQELLVNGGFEDIDVEGRPAGWSVSHGSLAISSNVVRPGNVALVGAAETIPAQVTQIVTAFQPGATYQLIGQARVSASNVQGVQLSIESVGPTSGVPIRAPPPTLRDTGGTFQELLSRLLFLPCDTIGVTATIELAKVDSAPIAYAYLDDVHLEAVGSPMACPTPTAPPVSTQPPPPGGSPPPAPTDPPAGPDAGGGPAGSAPLPMTSLLANGGFEVAEAGRPAGWRAQGGVLGQVASPAHGGRFAAAFASASASTKWAYQTVPVTSLAWYELDGYVYLDDSGVEGALLRVAWYASADGSGSALASLDSTEELVSPESRYRYLTTGPVQAPPGARSAKVRVLLRPRSATGGVIYIDDIALWPSGPGAAPGAARAASGRSSVRSGGGGSSDALGAPRSAGGASFAEQPTPVVRRSERS